MEEETGEQEEKGKRKMKPRGRSYKRRRCGGREVEQNKGTRLL